MPQLPESNNQRSQAGMRPLASGHPAGPPLAHPDPFLIEVCPHENETSRVVDHVSNIHYLEWLDRAAEMHMDAMGWTRADLLATGRMWFVARHEIDYLAEVRAGEVLYLATWVRDLRRAKSWRDSVLWRLDGDPDDEPRMVCTASTLWVLVDLKTRRPCRVPEAMTKALNPLSPRHR